MAGNVQRWAIAPPALEEETGELEEIPLPGTPIPDTTVNQRSADDPEVEVTFSARSWANDEAVGRADPAEQITGVRHTLQRDDELVEPMDTIPSPPSFGDD